MKNQNYLAKILAITLLFTASSSLKSQEINWQLKDLKKDGIFGISLDGAYQQLKGKKSKPVTVAILDSGVDTDHEDLKEVLWVNKKEKKGNGKDDDKNGYIDDIHGWGFIGGKSGNVNKDNLEITRLIRRGDGKTNLELQVKFDKEKGRLEANYNGTLAFKNTLDTVIKAIGKSDINVADINSFEAKSPLQKRVKDVLSQSLVNTNIKDFTEGRVNGPLNYFKEQLDFNYNLNFDPRNIVGDDYSNSREKGYGNANVTGEHAGHGTYVAGIVAAKRGNNLGLEGIADNVKIMAIRAVPDGDERDKDIANGIRYAVDNGAKVINMSFGKAYSWDKTAVDEAVEYAASKDVLLIQAAGNSGENIDEVPNFPTRKFEDGNIAQNWIVVGASGPSDDESLTANFSNFGKTSVDIFAPGVQIYSSTPGSKYEKFNGTSMAAPVVAGVAALIRSYFPKLTAVEVKDILLKSATKVDHKVSPAHGDKKESIDFSSLCVTGGIVNADAAVKLALEYSNNK
ncbi:S8 family serine peptidase [Pedobacter aquatilis]|uniref:S8 family serine peptidase n=1 Tax=Pedobacter aquatilis TaxID=351343 RepID=UPI00293187A7|nr:S8 family serine peptidase [Pedobacter aquatilis]